MSRIGNKPVSVPSGVTVTAGEGVLTVKGPKGELSQKIADGISFDIEGDVAKVNRANDSKPFRANHGLMRALLSNMVTGVSQGFVRKLEINGVGYRAAMQGNKLVLNLGYSHPVEMDVPAGLTVAVENNTQINISGADKQLLGQFASEVRSKRPPEPFKGKGVKYAEEHIVRKEGKKK